MDQSESPKSAGSCTHQQVQPIRALQIIQRPRLIEETAPTPSSFKREQAQYVARDETCISDDTPGLHTPYTLPNMAHVNQMHPEA